MYYFPTSPNALPVWLLLREAGIPFAPQFVDLMKGEHKGPAYLQINPQGQVPAFVDGKTSLSESGAILRYIGHTFKQASKFYPDDPKIRSHINAALDWRQTEFMPVVMKIIGVLFGGQIPQVVKDEASETLNQKSLILEWFIGEFPFIGGNVPSIADFALFPALSMLPHAGYTLSVKLSGYLNRLNSTFSSWNDISSSGFKQLVQKLPPKSFKVRPVLYYNPVSPNALAVQSLLLHANIPFDIKPLDLTKGEHKTPSYLALNPNGQVPTFVDSDGTVVFESNAILRYIAEKYAPKYYPKDPETRAVLDYALDWRQTTWLPAVSKASYAAVFGMPASKFPAEEGAKDLTNISPVLEGLLQDKDYIGGEDITIADFSFGPTLQFLKGSSWKLPKAIKAYRNRLFSDDAFKTPYEIALKDILKKVSAEPQELEDITSKVFESHTNNNKLVIIGGGFAGTKMAMSPVFSKKKIQVLMIDTKDYWECTPMVHRSLIQPERSDSLIVLHDRNLKGKWYRGQVTEVAKDYVVVDDLYLIRFNYLIIASGSRYPSVSGGNISKDQKKIVKKTEGNMKDQFSDATHRKKAIEVESIRIKNAKHIAVIGGGPVGIELMAELCTKYPNKKFTLIASQTTFMPETKVPNLHKKVAQFFHNYNVNLRMGEKVISVSESYGKYTLITDSELNKKIEADRVFYCAGLIPNTEFMKKHFATAVNEKGFIKVGDTLLVDKQNNIWAVGDCNSVPEVKTAFASSMHADYITKNFGKFLKGQKVPSYSPLATPPPITVLSLGPFRGVLTAGSKIVSTHKIAVAAKSTTATASINERNQDKAIMKIDYDKLLATSLKDNNKDKGEDSDDEKAVNEAKNLGLTFDWR
uniref:Glutathione transferase n=1 Tax=Arcella intermedia TaxID=1963864 RepID=A0A6B2KXX0_9EUKA